MCLRYLSDNSLVEEGREAQWSAGEPRPFSEPGVGPTYGPDRAFVLEHIALELRIDPDAQTLTGIARITIAPTPSGLGRVRLDIDELTVDAVEGPEGLSWRHRDGVLTVDGLDDRCEIEVRYHGSPRRGLYFVGPDEARPNRDWQAWTQCQDQDGHFVFPCFDHPSVKHTWSVRVLAPSDFTVIGNGQRGAVDAVDEGWRAWDFEQDEPMPAYLVTIVVARLEEHLAQHKGLALRYLVPPGTSAEMVDEVFGATPQMFEVLESAYGVEFPWPRYDQVVVSDFIFGGMENVAATTLTDVCLADSRALKDWDPERLLAHELAHQWFGDLLTCQDWSQGWLNEGWATFSEVVFLRERRGDDYAVGYVFDLATAYMAEATGRYARPIVSYGFREPIDVFDRHLYEKGACVLHTLRHELGDTAFWVGVRRYLEAHRHQTVHTRHFQRAMEEATGRNLDRFFEQWVHRAGHPVVTVGLEPADGQLRLKVEQAEGATWAFTLHVEVDGKGIDLAITEASHSLVIPTGEGSPTVRIDPGFRVLADLSLKGPVSLLVELLDDACPVTRIRAARALAKEAGPPAQTALVARLAKDGDFRVVREIAKELGALRGERARGALLAWLDLPDRPHRARAAVMTALAEFRGDAVVEDRLAAAVSDGDPSLYAEGAAAVALGRMHSARAVAACHTLLERDSWAEHLAAQGLVGLGATHDPAVLPTLLDYSGPQRSPRLRSAAAAAIGELADECEAVRSEALSTLQILATDAPFRVQLSSISALGRIRDPRASTVLRRIHGTAPDGRTRRQAYEALARIGDGRNSTAAMAGLRTELEKLQGLQSALRERVEHLEPIAD